MEDFVGDFNNLKLSALSKCKQISPFVKNTTLGPNSSLLEEEEEIVVSDTTVLESPKTSQSHVLKSSPNSTTIVSKLLAEMETQRQSKVQEAVKTRLKCILDFSKTQSSNSKQHLQRQQQALVDGVQQQELLILQALDQHDKDALIQQQQLLQYYRELAEKRKQHNKEIEEHELRRQKISALIDTLKKDQVEFRNAYQEIINIFKSCKFQGQLRDVLGDIPKQLKALPDSMEEIVTRCKAGKISENETQRSAELLQEIKGLLVTVQEKVATLNAEEKQVKDIPKPQPVGVGIPQPVGVGIPQPVGVGIPQPVGVGIPQPVGVGIPQPVGIGIPPATPVPTSITVPQPISNTKAPEIKSSRIDQFISKSSLKVYSELQDYLENYTKLYGELEADVSFKQFRFDCKKAVNIPVNAISAVNSHHLLDKYNRLTDLLLGRTVEVGNTKVCAARHPQGVAFCTNLLARKFVLQGDLMISSNPEAAFCYAAIIVAIWHDNPDFGKLILGHFHKQCPYLVPLYPPRAIGQSDEEFYLSQGYQYTDGVVEKQDKFLKRMTGIMRLYAAIVISKPKRGQHKNPHGLTEGWRWLAAFLNLEPKPDITATMLHVFFEIAGSSLQNAYGKSFQKVMMYICQVYLPMIQKIDSGGPVTRLEVLLQEFLKHGHFEAPHGVLPPNFW